MKKSIRLFTSGISAQEILHFFRQLSTLISAGITLMKSLDILIQTNENRIFCSFLQTIRLDLENGKEFNRCLQRHPSLFDFFSCQLIRIGEQTGTLDHTLKRVTLYKEKNQTLRKQFKQALIYPTLILISAIITTLILLLLVVPQFASLFEHFPNKLPLITQILIQLSLILHQWLPYFGLLCLLSLFAIFNFRKSPLIQKRCQQLLFQLPFLRQLTLKIVLVQFSRTLAVILAAGLPLTEALMMAAQLLPFDVLRRDILKIYAGVHSGKPLSTNLQLSPFFPALLVHMTKTGEESGTLDFMLEKFADIYETHLEQTLNSLRLLLEPLIIAILGVLIGGIVIAMYLPIFRLGTALS